MAAWSGASPVKAKAESASEALLLYCDGASRRNGAGAAGDCAAAAVLKNGATEEIVVQRAVRLSASGTNNIAEYEAVLLGVRMAATVAGKAAAVRAFVDSELLVKQFTGEYKCKAPALRARLAALRQAIRGVGSFALRQVPREQNAEADALANRALDELSEGMEITAGPEAEAVRAAEEAFSREQAAGGASVLTVAALEAHERATGGGAGVGRERRMFVCEVHGPFFKRVDALKPVARCFGVPGTKPCGRGRLDPVPREEERGEGLFECGQCGQKWADMLARWDVCQPCPGEKEGEGEGEGGECGNLVAPFKLRPLPSMHQRSKTYRLKQYNKREGSSRAPSESGLGGPTVYGPGGGGGGGGAGGGGGSYSGSDSYMQVGRGSGPGSSSGSDSGGFTHVKREQKRRPRRSRHKCALCATGQCRQKPAASRPHLSTGSTVSNASSVSELSSLDRAFFRMDIKSLA